MIEVAPFGLELYSTTSKASTELRLPLWQIQACRQTRIEPRFSQWILSAQQCELTSYFSRNNSVLVLALLHNTHTSCTTGRNQIDSQLRLTYSRNLIQLHNYTYLLTKSKLPAFRLVQNFIFQIQLVF